MGRSDRRAEKAAAEGKNWKTDLSGGIQRVAIKHGCSPFGNAKARCHGLDLPGSGTRFTASRCTPRGAIWSTKYPTYEDRKSFWRLPTRYQSIQATDYSSRTYPIILTSGRLVEYEGGGDETRSNPWLAELQQDMFVEIHPRDANNARHQGWRRWSGSRAPRAAKVKVKAMVTRARRVGGGVHAIPLRRALPGRGFAAASIPEGADPYVLGEAANTAHDLRLRFRHTDAGIQM